MDLSFEELTWYWPLGYSKSRGFRQWKVWEISFSSTTFISNTFVPIFDMILRLALSNRPYRVCLPPLTWRRNQIDCHKLMFSDYLEFQTMDKDQTLSDSKCQFFGVADTLNYPILNLTACYNLLLPLTNTIQRAIICIFGSLVLLLKQESNKTE
jgi:hypothetical protein